MSLTGMIAYLGKESRQDYADAMKVISSENREYVSAEEIRSKVGLWSIAGHLIVTKEKI